MRTFILGSCWGVEELRRESGRSERRGVNKRWDGRRQEVQGFRIVRWHGGVVAMYIQWKGSGYAGRRVGGAAATFERAPRRRLEKVNSGSPIKRKRPALHILDKRYTHIGC